MFVCVSFVPTFWFSYLFLCHLTFICLRSIVCSLPVLHYTHSISLSLTEMVCVRHSLSISFIANAPEKQHIILWSQLCSAAAAAAAHNRKGNCKIWFAILTSAAAFVVRTRIHCRWSCYFPLQRASVCARLNPSWSLLSLCSGAVLASNTKTQYPFECVCVWAVQFNLALRSCTAHKHRRTLASPLGIPWYARG